jgi:hypothetical protein
MAQPADASAAKNRACFFSRNFQTWKAPDNRTMYIRVGMTNYYKLEMAGTCYGLTGINPHLVTTFRGTDSVCSALDWDLKVAQSPNSPAVACIVKTMTPMTAEEVSAIPKKFKP